MSSVDPSLAHLHARLALVVERMRTAVSVRRAFFDPAVHGGHGAFVSDDEVDRLLAPPVWPTELSADQLDDLARVEKDAGPGDLRLRRLASTFGLSALDQEILLVATAPELDDRVELLCGYLHDDLTRRRPSVGLALELCGESPWSEPARSRLYDEAPLVRFGLVAVEKSDRPFFSRAVRIQERVVAFLLGGDLPDPAVSARGAEFVPVTYGPSALLRRAVQEGHWLAYVREGSGTSAGSLAAGVFRGLGLDLVAVDLRRPAPPIRPESVDVVTAAVREAALQVAGLVIGPVEELVRQSPESLRRLAGAPVPVVVTGAEAWEATWTDEVPFLLEAPEPDAGVRREVWARVLSDLELQMAEGVDAGRATAQFVLTPEQTLRAARAAGAQAAAAGHRVDVEILRASVRAQNAGRLETRCRRIPARASFDELVLPERMLEELRDIARWAQSRELVRDRWGMGGQGSKGQGVTALFAGSSGTGKTLAAEAVASSLGFDLYTVNLSSVVDKYIGETEKHLERIFDEAEGVNGVLFFDEADALFGKRSETKEAKDRYANQEIAYLLSRMELFDGVAVLATNLKANLDEAFTRRLDAIINFPDPAEPERLRLWRIHVPDLVPLEGTIDFEFLASAFTLTGGDIRNVCLAAARRAAARDIEPCGLSMADLVWAAAREYRKLGRLVSESEFGPWHEAVRAGL